MGTPETIDRIRAALQQGGAASSDYDLHPDLVLPEGRRLRPAAVLVPLIGGQEDGLRLILTKRASGLKHHPGQIAFPGGKQDEGDATLTDTALREAREEIGLPPENVSILGELAPHETVTGFLVTPIVGLVTAPFDVIAEAGEVEEVFEVPLAHVMDEEKFLVQSRLWRGQQRKYFTVPYGPYYIWGATARMLRSLAGAVAR
ncbi:putative NUDIX hydrolase [Pseudoruegeria aquimaris]|uniref:Putative NUDIX hydrolase n=1 Tax=Pseudoruegeria aquimaris TaxID=393663 RepID=A0A1Y5RT04_9RHOB|nr:CoA pyrophosphatase [Pseudoruegeria aquimaris]SLN24802.1 putative NUDIX hydrolase [Pseudoruegeria aquimaris]